MPSGWSGAVGDSAPGCRRPTGGGCSHREPVV